MGSLIQQHSVTGAATNSATETFSAATAGNLLLLVVSTNENAGTSNINTPTGYTLLKQFRQGTTVTNIAVFGKIAAGGETSVTVTVTAATQRMQTWFGEFNGYTLTLDGSGSTAGNSSAVFTGDTGTTSTPAQAGTLYIGVVSVKNRDNPFTEGGGFSVATVNNEVTGNSAQALSVGVYYDLNRSAPAREQPTWTNIAAAYSGLGILLTPFFVNPVDATVTVNRNSVVNASTKLEIHALHVQNSIRGKPNGNGQHNAAAISNAITACDQVFDGHAAHIGGPGGGFWQALDPYPNGGITVGTQGGGTTLAVDNGTHFPAGGSSGLLAKVYDTRSGTTFTFTGVSGNNLTGCSGLPGSIPAGSPVLLYQFTGNGTGDRPLLFDNNQSLSIKELFDSMAGTKRTLVLHGASIWMHGQSSMTFPPKTTYMKTYAYGCAEIVAQFAANGTPITDVSIWNEFKGFASNSPPGSGQGGTGTTQSGVTGVMTPTDSGAIAAADSHYIDGTGAGSNGYEMLHYTLMYNAVWDAFKNHPNSAVNTVKVHGPHFNIGSVGAGTGWDHLYPFGTFDGTLQASGFKNGTHVPNANDRDRLCYFLDYATGYDGLTLDFSIVDNNTPSDANETFVYTNHTVIRDIVRQVKSVLANRSGLSTADRAATINFIEYYSDVNLARQAFQTTGGGFTDLQQGVMEGLLLRTMLEEGVSRAYKWQPMGDDTSGLMWNKGSYFLTTQISNTGVSRNSSAIVGETNPPNLPGAVVPAHGFGKLFHETFPVGSVVYATSCDDASGKIWSVASATKTLVVNGYSTSKIIHVEGADYTVPAYSIMSLDAANGSTVVLISGVGTVGTTSKTTAVLTRKRGIPTKSTTNTSAAVGKATLNRKMVVTSTNTYTSRGTISLSRRATSNSTNTSSGIYRSSVNRAITAVSEGTSTGTCSSIALNKKINLLSVGMSGGTSATKASHILGTSTSASTSGGICNRVEMHGYLAQQQSAYTAIPSDPQDVIVQTFNPAQAGNLLILVTSANENAGTVNINMSTGGWTRISEYSGPGTNDVRIAVFGKIADGGETSVTVTFTAQFRRTQAVFMEFKGYTMGLDGPRSIASSSALVTTGDTGTVTPLSSDLYIGIVAVKNQENNTGGLTEGGGFSTINVSNQTDTGTSINRLTVGVWYDLTRTTPAREQPTWTQIAARYAGMGLLFQPVEDNRLFTVSNSTSSGICVLSRNRKTASASTGSSKGTATVIGTHKKNIIGGLIQIGGK